MAEVRNPDENNQRQRIIGAPAAPNKNEPNRAPPKKELEEVLRINPKRPPASKLEKWLPAVLVLLLAFQHIYLTSSPNVAMFTKKPISDNDLRNKVQQTMNEVIEKIDCSSDPEQWICSNKGKEVLSVLIKRMFDQNIVEFYQETMDDAKLLMEDTIQKGLIETSLKRLQKSQGQLMRSLISGNYSAINEELSSKVIESISQEASDDQTDTEALKEVIKAQLYTIWGENYQTVKKPIEETLQKIQTAILNRTTNTMTRLLGSSVVQNITNLEIVDQQMPIRPIFYLRAYGGQGSSISNSDFWKKLDGVAHTVNLVGTEFGKHIIAYTPIAWSSQKNGTYLSDPSLSSFIGSIDHNVKFTLQNPDYATRQNVNRQAIFGAGRDLRICCNCGDVKSYIKVGTSYKNPDYPLDEHGNIRIQTTQMLIGSEQNTFECKYFEVYVAIYSLSQLREVMERLN